MATKVELKASITKWKKVIANPKTKDSVKKILKKSIDKAEKQITDLEGAIEQSKKAALPSAVKSSGQKTAAQLIKEAKDRRQSQGLSTRQSDVEKDAGRKAKPKGYRISKYGNKYWEGRDNRIDVKQPPITYPKLEDGGMMAKGGAVTKEYRISPMIPTGVKGMITTDYQKMERFSGTEDEAVARAKEMASSNPNFVRVEVKLPLKTKVNTVAMIDGQNKQYADGGMMADARELKVREDFKYQNTAKRWLDDHDRQSLAYKVAVLLLKGDKNPNETLNIDYNRYDRILRTLDSISESKHEMAWRTENYSQAEAERWAKESVSEIFELNNMMAEGGEVNGDKMADGGYMAKGGEITPYIVWVSKDGNKREFYGEYKSMRAANMKMDKLWESGEYKNIGNKPKSKYEKEGFYKDGGYMAKGGKVKVAEYLVTLTDEDGFEDDVVVMAKSEDDAVYQAEKIRGYESSETGVVMLTDFDGKKIEYAKGGKTQGYDDKEDERLAMKYGKIGSKDLNSTHARRDDARFEERGKMADGGIMAKGVDIKKLQIGDEIKFPNGEIWKVSKPGVKYGKVFLAPFNDIAKKGHISIAIEFEPYELKDAVANKMEDGGTLFTGGYMVDVYGIKDGKRVKINSRPINLKYADKWVKEQGLEKYYKEITLTFLGKMADGGMMAKGGEVLKEYEVEFTWDTSDDESRSVYIKANSEDEARRKASDRYKAYKEFKIIKVVDTASPYWHD